MSLNEAQLQKAVIQLARLRGYRVAHFPRGQNKGAWMTPLAADAKGYPDLTLARPGRVLWIECKADRGYLSPEQKEWQALLGDAYFVVRPRDYPAGVKAILS